MTTIRLNEFNYGFLGSRAIARQVRNRVAQALEKGGDVALDFSGIEEITDSFVNELLGKLLAEARQPILHRLRFKNCTPSVKLTIEVLLADAVAPRA